MPSLIYDAGGDIGHDLQALAMEIERLSARLSAQELRIAELEAQGKFPPVVPEAEPGTKSPGADEPPARKSRRTTA